MEHDKKCEKFHLVQQVRVRLNATPEELNEIRAKDLCFCWERTQWGQEYEVKRDAWVDRVSTAVSIVVERRTTLMASVQIGEEGTLEKLKAEIDEQASRDEGRVVWVDFQARRRITD